MLFILFFVMGCLLNDENAANFISLGTGWPAIIFVAFNKQFAAPVYLLWESYETIVFFKIQ